MMLLLGRRQFNLRLLLSSIMPRPKAFGDKSSATQSKTKKNILKPDEGATEFNDTKVAKSNVKTEPVDVYYDEEKKSITLDLSKFKFAKKPHIKIEFENDSPVKEEPKGLWEPPHWRDFLLNLRNMRANADAPVDTMGCHMSADRSAPPHTKVKYIKKTTQTLKEQYNSDIPDSVEKLCKLTGVGPKMAHICMSVAWNKVTGIGVDTHVHRISNRIGWVKKPTATPEDTRKALESWLPFELWGEVNHLLVGFGQTICLPIGPNCEECLNNDICPSRGIKTSPKKKTPVKVEKTELPDGKKETKRKITPKKEVDEGKLVVSNAKSQKLRKVSPNKLEVGIHDNEGNVIGNSVKPQRKRKVTPKKSAANLIDNDDLGVVADSENKQRKKTIHTKQPFLDVKSVEDSLSVFNIDGKKPARKRKVSPKKDLADDDDDFVQLFGQTKGNTQKATVNCNKLKPKKSPAKKKSTRVQNKSDDIAEVLPVHSGRKKSRSC